MEKYQYVNLDDLVEEISKYEERMLAGAGKPARASVALPLAGAVLHLAEEVRQLREQLAQLKRESGLA